MERLTGESADRQINTNNPNTGGHPGAGRIPIIAILLTGSVSAAVSVIRFRQTAE